MNNPINNPNLSDAKVNALLAMAGKKLGQDPQTLKQQLESGKIDGIMQNMDPKSREQITGFLNDQKKMEALFADEKVKNLLFGILGGQK